MRCSRGVGGFRFYAMELGESNIGATIGFADFHGGKLLHDHGPLRFQFRALKTHDTPFFPLCTTSTPG